MKSLRRTATVADWQPHPLDARVTRHPRTHTLTRTYRVAYKYILYIASPCRAMDITYAVEHAHDENILTHELPLDKEVESKNLPRENVYSSLTY